jgi:hypothetical protein
MADATYRRALTLEFGTMLTVAFVVGAALALVAGILVVPLIDPLPTIPPGPLVVAPVAALAVVVAALACVTWAGAWLTSARARRTDLGEVMRLAD